MVNGKRCVGRYINKFSRRKFIINSPSWTKQAKMPEMLVTNEK